MADLRVLLRLSHPIHLLLAALTYCLGAGIARYLNLLSSVPAFWLGLGGALLLQLSMALLTEVFRPFNDPILPDETRTQRLALRNAALLISVSALAAVAVIALLLGRAGSLSPSAALFMGISLLVVLAQALPPVRLVNSGFGELALAVHLASLIPALAFLFQAGEYHPLVAMVTFPLLLLALAYLLALDFPALAGNQKYDRRTLLRRIGWERAVPLHHGLVLGTYLLFAAGLLIGFSFSLLWPAFLTLPFAILQILWLRHITLGGRPVWKFQIALTQTVFGLTVYFLVMTFWLR